MSHRSPGFIAINVAAGIGLLGTTALALTPRLQRMQDRMRESTVRANCHVAQIAAENFALDYWGVYPDTVAAFLSYLPESQWLMNPYTHAQTEPVDGAAGSPGQVGYQPIAQYGVNTGYNIFGAGKYGVELVRLSNFNGW